MTRPLPVRALVTLSAHPSHIMPSTLSAISIGSSPASVLVRVCALCVCVCVRVSACEKDGGKREGGALSVLAVTTFPHPLADSRLSVKK
jgi:hypothetical protein